MIVPAANFAMYINIANAMTLYQKIYVTRSTIYMESFILVSQSAQLSHYAALLLLYKQYIKQNHLPHPTVK